MKPTGRTPTASDIRAANRKAVGGGPKRCRKGKNCSATCIANNKYCLVGLPEPASNATGKVAKMLQQRADAKRAAGPGDVDTSALERRALELEREKMAFDSTVRKALMDRNMSTEEKTKIMNKNTQLSQDLKAAQREIALKREEAAGFEPKVQKAAAEIDQRADRIIAAEKRRQEFYNLDAENKAKSDANIAMAESIKAMSPEQKASLEMYGENASKNYLAVNTALRTGSIDNVAPNQVEAASLIVNNLPQVLNSIPVPPGGTPVSRAVSGDFAANLANLKPGSVIQDNGFGSYTDKDSNRTLDTFFKPSTGSNAIIKVRNSSGRNVSELMRYDEGEHITMPGTKLRLVDVNPEGGYSRKAGTVPVYTFEEIQ